MDARKTPTVETSAMIISMFMLLPYGMGVAVHVLDSRSHSDASEFHISCQTRTGQKPLHKGNGKDSYVKW